MQGKAADIVIKRMTIDRWKDIMPATMCDQMYYDVKKKFVHVSYDSQANRNQKWVKE